MTDEELAATMQEKDELNQSQSAEIDHLRSMLSRLRGLIDGTLASYMAPAGWIKQNADGSIGPGQE